MHDTLINALSEIWAYQKQRPALIHTGTQALHRLIPVALSRTRQGETIRSFLLGLYDGATYRFALKDLYRLNQRDFQDCLHVLEMDHMPEVEVHQRVEQGDSVWRELMEVSRTQPVALVCRQPLRPSHSHLCAKNRREIEAKGIEAFDRLLQVAERSTGQSRIAAKFLMSLIHHNDYRLNLTDLRGLDIKVFEDCMNVLRMDYITDAEATRL